MGNKKPNVPERAGRIAKKAAEILEDRGWTRGTLQRSSGELCIRGAMSLVQSQGRTAEATYSHQAEAEILANWFAEHVPDSRAAEDHSFRVRDVMYFNDSVFESQQDAVAWLRKAGEDLDRK